MANEPNFQYCPPQEPLTVLHVDKDILCVVKPCGLLSVPGRGADRQDSLYTRVLTEYPLAQMVHRLDMDTSGVMIVALRRKAERELKAQFRERTVQKRYEAIVYGDPNESGTIDAPLMRHPTQKLRHCVHKEGKPSVTNYTKLSSKEQYSWVELVPLTGRSHQLRVHLSHLRLPIVGDRFYAPLNVVGMCERLLLHASDIRFTHPYSGDAMHFNAPSGFDKWLDWPIS